MQVFAYGGKVFDEAPIVSTEANKRSFVCCVAGLGNFYTA